MATTLKALKARHERERLSLEIAEMQTQRDRFETVGRLAVDPNSRPLLEAWGDLLDPKDYLADVSGFGPSSVSGGDANARKDGVYRPFIETDSDLQEIRSLARNVVQVSPSARCVLNNLTSYILGNGFEYTAADKNGKPKEKSELATAVQEVIDEFLSTNKWELMVEPEALRRAYRDGEFFVALFKRRRGVASVRFIEPEYVVEPIDKRAIEEREGLGSDCPVDWGFGVATDHDDVQSVHGYHVQWPGSLADFDYFPHRRMVHCKMGVDSTVKRGISDYYSVVQYLTDGAKLLRNTVKGAAVLAAIAAITEHAPGVGRDAVESLRAGGSFASRADTTMAGGMPQTRYTKKYEPGTILHAPNGLQMKAGPLSNNSMGESCVAIEQAVLRIAGSNWCMPEYMVSGDASNANYSSTLVAESPFVKYCERMQRFFSWTFEEVLWRVLEIAIEAGRIKFSGTVDELKRFITIKIEPPQVSSRNAVEETNRRQVLSSAGLLSKETWAAQEGLDYEQEQASGAGAIPTIPTSIPTVESTDPVKLAQQLLWSDYPGGKKSATLLEGAPLGNRNAAKDYNPMPKDVEVKPPHQWTKQDILAMEKEGKTIPKEAWAANYDYAVKRGMRDQANEILLAYEKANKSPVELEDEIKAYAAEKGVDIWGDKYQSQGGSKYLRVGTSNEMIRIANHGGGAGSATVMLTTLQHPDTLKSNVAKAKAIIDKIAGTQEAKIPR